MVVVAVSPSPHLVRATSLSTLPWLHHAFSTREGGTTTVYGRPDDLNLGLTEADDSINVLNNRRLLLEASGPPGATWPLTTARQTHSTLTQIVRHPLDHGGEADALLTSTSRIFLGILTADCVPILLADTRLRIVAAIHAGWRGTAEGIVEKSIVVLRDEFGSHPDDLHAAIGPSVGPCCYQISDHVRDRFHPSLLQEDRLDLWQANRLQLRSSGVPSKNIETLSLCTACTRSPNAERLFFSHRAEGGGTGRMMSLIGIE